MSIEDLGCGSTVTLFVNDLARLSGNLSEAGLQAAGDLGSQILWKNTRYQEALFISEGVLRQSSISELPLDERNRKALALKVELVRDPPARHLPHPSLGPVDECRLPRKSQ
ncbi:MAG: hypothetical protein AAF481_11190 [Acidobacteriota bacterium]